MLHSSDVQHLPLLLSPPPAHSSWVPLALSHRPLSSSLEMLVDDSSAGFYAPHICASRAPGKAGCFPGAWQRVCQEGNTAGTATTAGVKVSVSLHVLKPLGFSTGHPLLSNLAHATRELPTCIGPMLPSVPPRYMGRMSQPR